MLCFRLSEDIGYVLYSALGSFYIPSCIMVFVYIRIYFAAKARVRRGIRKQQKPNASKEKCTSFTNAPIGDNNKLRMPDLSSPVDKNRNSPMKNVVTIETISPSIPPTIPIVTCDFASDISTSENADLNNPTEGNDSGYLDAPKDTLKIGGGEYGGGSSSSGSLLSTAAKFRGSTLSVNGDLGTQQQHSTPSVIGRCRAPSVGIDTDMVSEFDPSSSDSGVVSRCAVVKPLKLRFCKPIFGRKASKAKREAIDLGKMPPLHEPQQQPPPNIEELPRIEKPKNPEREKRRIARKKEKRATLILGLIMGSFIACWLPFFFLYILTPLCGASCNVPKRAFAFAFWLGYTNSALNPVIYTIFNKDFRRAFRRILFK
ncbi:class A rhodopsin-like G-protein coupled receptor GPRadr1, putative [Pediculus humanus corporis]|uniref:Class A rhodopsin-like G-protein coupled receptor GPRadr1, putative n=1 Tax=Pediculus humanus subsp. corporis TaxID=121224 RepID=E0VVA6_PEDHC|nr:class A rhodopsin-like G-protein coupled receptor GPRadr1, putative [Pediculus humanus corporis]EEB17312.1 class A rhodopsin-like G-protein coupled receptor GPRadr1, putative [Pediculus humanus corporis]